MDLKKISKDRLNIVFIGIVVIIGFAFYVLLFRKTSNLTATVKVGEEDINYYPFKKLSGSSLWFTNLLRPGMVELDGLGRKQAEIVDTFIFDTSANTKVAYITLDLKTVYNKASNTHNYKGMNVLVGSTIKLNLNRVMVEGLITSIEGVPDDRKKVTVIVETKLKDENQTYLETSGVEPYVADAIKVGDKMVDSNGKVMVEVIEKKMKDALRSSTNNTGVTRIDINPLRKDVYLKLKIGAIKIKNRYFVFDDIPILVGEEIPFNTKYYSIFPEITDIIEVN